MSSNPFLQENEEPGHHVQQALAAQQAQAGPALLPAPALQPHQQQQQQQPAAALQQPAAMEQDPEIIEVASAAHLRFGEGTKFPAILLPLVMDIPVHIEKTTDVSALRTFLSEHRSIHHPAHNIELISNTLTMHNGHRVYEYVHPVGPTLIKVKLNFPRGKEEPMIHIQYGNKKGGKKFWKGGRGGRRGGGAGQGQAA